MILRDLVTTRPRASTPLRSLRDEWDQLFEEWMGGDPFRREPTGMLVTHVDVVETETEVRVTAELPGMDEKEIKLELSGDRLIVAGERHREHEEKHATYFCRERRFGSIRREIPLPCEVNQENARAVFSKGVLTITLPKTAEARQRTRSIPIHSG